jgi:tetratricopeptide (TPR) repeat protein
VRAQIRAAWDAASAAPEDGTASGGLGMVLSAYGQSEQARSCYLRARRLDPAEFRWPYYEAISLGDLGRLDEAIGVMGTALALRPDHPEARLRLAEWLAQTGDPARARALYEAVLAADPRRPEARLGLGRLLLEQGDAQGAVDQLRAALDADWRVGEVHYALSRALRELGDQTGAEQHAALFKRFEKRRLHLADPWCGRSPSWT